MQANRDEDLDVVILDVENQEYKLHFKPFIIGSGSLFVGDLRNFAAKQLNAKAGEVRLKYNGQELNEDHRTAKYYGIRRNSTVLCTLGEVSRNAPAGKSCPHGRITAGEAVTWGLDFVTAPGAMLSPSTQELSQFTTDFSGLDHLSTQAPVPRQTCTPIVISHEGSSPQASEHGLELLSTYTASDSGAKSTAFTSIEGDLDHKAARNVAKATMDVKTTEDVFMLMGDHLQDEDVSFPSTDISEALETRQDFSIAHRKISSLNLTEFSVRLVDVGSFLGNDNVKLVAIPDYRAARYMIFDWYDASTEDLWTTKQNLAQRMLGGTFGELPEGLRTAIITSRAFGIRYLWISTICTITDDEADIKRQSISMDGVLFHAVGLFKTAGSVNVRYIQRCHEREPNERFN
jgi:hypothetical protein